MISNFQVPGNWYETFFTGPANRFWEAMVPPEATAAEIAFIARQIGEPSQIVIDAPCGAGRHALGLARAGYHVVGVDISAEAIGRAEEAARAEALSAEFRIADMRRFALDEPADAIVSLGNSISYFDEAGTRALFENFARNVRRGGWLVIDTGCCAESVLPDFKAERRFDVDGGDYRSAVFYDPMTSTLKTKALLRLGEETHELRYAHRIVTTGELIRALDTTGFETLGLYRDTDDNEFSLGAPRLLVVALRK